MSFEEKRPDKLLNKQYVMFSLINLIVSISFSMVSTTISKYAYSVGTTVAVAGAVAGVFSISALIVRPFSGVISDRMNRKTLLVISTLAMAVCTFFYGLVSDTGMLFLLRILHGAAFCVSSTVNMAMIPAFSPKDRVGEAVSYFGLSQTLAVFIGPSLGLALADAGGFPLNFMIAAVIVAAGGVIALLMDFQGTQVTVLSEARGKFSIRLKDIVATESLIFAGINIAMAATSGVENSLIALYGAAAGMGNIGWYFTLSAVALIISRLAFGKLADRRGLPLAMYLGTGLMIVGFLLLWNLTAVWMLAASAVIKTVGSGIVRPAVQAECIKSVPPDKRGAAASTFYIGSDIGQGVSPWLAGQIVDSSGGNYGLAFSALAAPLALAAFLFAIFYKKRKGAIHPA
ncbi:MAG: MFS transporter [Bacillota bacterium]